SVRSRDEARNRVWAGDPALDGLWLEGYPHPVAPDPKVSGTCNYSLPSPEEWKIHCETTGPGFVWLSQSFYPGRKATVNGAQRPVYAAHLLFQAVPIGKGASDITLRYAPAYFPWLFILCAAGVCAPLALFVSGEIKRLRADRTKSSET